MPCYDSRDRGVDFGTYDALRDRFDEQQRKLNKVTRLLCEAMKIIEYSRVSTDYSLSNASKELKEWWRKHQALDKKRKRR